MGKAIVPPGTCITLVRTEATVAERGGDITREMGSRVIPAPGPLVMVKTLGAVEMRKSAGSDKIVGLSEDFRLLLLLLLRLLLRRLGEFEVGRLMMTWAATLL